MMMRFISKRRQNISAYSNMAKTLTNHWPNAKPRNVIMLVLSCRPSELIGHAKPTGKVTCIGVGNEPICPL